MRSYVVTFTDVDGDTCEVDQPARSAVDAVRSVHRGYGHFCEVRTGRRYYQVRTPFGIETVRVDGYNRAGVI